MTMQGLGHARNRGQASGHAVGNAEASIFKGKSRHQDAGFNQLFESFIGYAGLTAKKCVAGMSPNAVVSGICQSQS